MSSVNICDPRTYAFIKQIKESKTVNTTVFSLFGCLMYLLTCTSYVLLANSFSHDRLHDYSWCVLGIHLLVGLLVFFDTLYFAGSSVALQTFIIGLGTFNTFSLAAITGSTIALNQDDESLAFCFVSLLLACLSNAMMIALLFAMFHKKKGN